MAPASGSNFRVAGLNPSVASRVFSPVGEQARAWSLACRQLPVPPLIGLSGWRLALIGGAPAWNPGGSLAWRYYLTLAV